jgi:uncharacterized protein (TIGR03435 family)
VAQQSANSVSKDGLGRKTESLQFEVASVKESKEGTPFRSNVPLDGLDDGPRTIGLLSANAPLMAYLIFAYRINDPAQGHAFFDHLPDWAKHTFYGIDARAEAASSKDDLRLMMQSLLSDRFRLRVHVESQQHEIVELQLATPGHFGPSLRQHFESSPCSSEEGAGGQPNPAKVEKCGMTITTENGQKKIHMADVTMPQIAQLLCSLAMQDGTMVTPHVGIDHTGLPGRFDLDLRFVPENDDSDSVDNTGGPHLEEAVEKQLGIRLVRTKGPMPVLMIDHLERPSEN